MFPLREVNGISLEIPYRDWRFPWSDGVPLFGIFQDPDKNKGLLLGSFEGTKPKDKVRYAEEAVKKSSPELDNSIASMLVSW